MIFGSFKAMGTVVSVATESTRGIEETRSLFAELERQLSRFDPTSELCRLNDAGGGVVSDTLGAALDIAAEMSQRTGGLVDPALGSHLEAWGYDRSFELIQEVTTVPSVRHRQSWDREGMRLMLRNGSLLDLGGTAKGWACDLAIDAGLAVMVAAGGDLRSVDPELIVDVVDPTHGRLCSVRVGVGALATSTTEKRTWKAGAIRAHHIIDPRTGDPAVTPISTSSAVCSTAAEAEAAAKAILLMGADGLRWADRQPWIRGAVAAWHDGSVYATTDLAVAA